MEDKHSFLIRSQTKISINFIKNNPPHFYKQQKQIYYKIIIITLKHLKMSLEYLYFQKYNQKIVKFKGKRKLSLQAERAAWAAAFIRKIMGLVQYYWSIKEAPSLRDFLLNTQLSHRKFQFSPEAKRSVTKIFDFPLIEGDNESEECQTNFHQNLYLQSQIICPNYLTRKMCYFLFSDSHIQDVQITGQHKNGKSSAVRLLIKLIDFVTIFYCKAMKDKKFLEELHWLAHYKFIDDHFNYAIRKYKVQYIKYWYWNVEKIDFQQDWREYLKNLFISQSFGLETSEIQQLKDFDIRGRPIKQFTELANGFYCLESRVIVDNIQVIASLKRYWEAERTAYAANRSTMTEAKRRHYESIINEYEQSYRTFKNIFFHYRRAGSSFLAINSSVDQIRHFSKYETGKNVMLHRQSTVDYIITKQSKRRRDYYHTIIYEVERELHKMKIAKQQIEKIRMELFKELLNLNPSVYPCYYHFKMKFKDKGFFTNIINSIESLNRLVEDFKELIKNWDQQFRAQVDTSFGKRYSENKIQGEVVADDEPLDKKDILYLF